MTGLVGMVAKRGGEVLGEVFDSYRDDLQLLDAGGEPQYIPSAGEHITAILSPSGMVLRIREIELTFHPADPAPTFASVATSLGADVWEANPAAGVGPLPDGSVAMRPTRETLERDCNALRQSLRTTLGLADDAGDGEIVERAQLQVFNLQAARSRFAQVESDLTHILRPDYSGPAMDASDSLQIVRQMCRRLSEEGGTPDEDSDWTADPPPPAPEGEERWYRCEHEDDKEKTHLRVKGGNALLTCDGYEDESTTSGAKVFDSWSWSIERHWGKELRSPHPVLPPLWAADAWTAEPLPEPPAEGSRWWGFEVGATIEVVERRPDGAWRTWVKGGKVSWWSRMAITPEQDFSRRTVSPIARPGWCRE